MWYFVRLTIGPSGRGGRAGKVTKWRRWRRTAHIICHYICAAANCLFGTRRNHNDGGKSLIAYTTQRKATWTWCCTPGFFCAFGPKLRSHKNSAFRQKTGNFTRNSGKISQKLRYSETFSIAQYIRFFKNSAQAAKTQIKFRKTQLFGYICMFLYQKSAQTKSLVVRMRQ